MRKSATDPAWRLRKDRVAILKGHSGRLRFLVLLMTACVWASPSGAGDNSSLVSEYQVKAAFLYNFAKFIEWPAEAFSSGNAPIQLCLAGEDPFGPLLEQTIQGKAAQGREMRIKRLKENEDLRACHILFVGPAEDKRLAQIMDRLNGASVLTVGETHNFTRLGGVITLGLEQNKVRFEVNLQSAERARLKVSSKLLTLARVVRSEAKD